MADIAELGFQIDSSPAAAAADNLDRMSTSSAKAQTATERMQAQIDRTTASVREYMAFAKEIQRFGSALNLNVHFHMLFLDGVYEEDRGTWRLRRARAPTSEQLTHLAQTIARRVCRHLARIGYLDGEDENAYLSERAARDDGLDAVRMSSITYRIATGPHAGRKVTTLQTLPGDAGPIEAEAGKVGGFSLHAGVAATASEGGKLERLCRYISRPAISEKRLSITPQGQVRYALKTPWRDGTTHVEFAPLDFLARLAALVPPPRAHLTRYHGIFAPNANLRAQLTPAGRGRRPDTSASTHPASEQDGAPADHRTPAEKRAAMTWAQRLKGPSNNPDWTVQVIA